MDLNFTQNLKRVRRFLGVFCLCGFFSMRAGMALAASGEEKSLAAAQAAYKAKNYSLAIKLFRPLAVQGNADGQFNLGGMYANGQGVEKDYAKAFKWYRKAAEQGDAGGQFNLGVMYANGQGVEKDYAKALKWYRKVAEQGNALGQLNLGVMYSNGQGVEKDYAKAFKWYRKAAEQGNADAQYNLGVMYANGQGVEKDYAKALKWSRKSAEQGDAAGQYMLGWMYSNGQGVEKDYVKAVKWYRKAAEQGNALGQFNLGVMYTNGQGVEKDYAKAFKWYRKSAEQGNDRGQLGLGAMYSDGQGVPQNYVEAYKWFALAGAQGDAIAFTIMGDLSQKMTPDQIAKAQELASSWKAVGQAAAPQSSGLAIQQAADIQSPNPPKKEIRSSVDTPDYHLSPKPDDFAVVVGIEDYDNDLPQSEFSKRDAKAFKSHLLAMGVPPSHIQFLIGRRATGNALKARIEEWLPKNVKPDSTVFFYFSGHGAPDPATGDAYLVPFDGDPEYLTDTAYPLKHLYAELSGLKAHRVIAALDSCFSGAGGRSIIAKGTRPLVSEIKEGVIPRNGKLIVLTASKSDQISGVIESAGHGAFTYYFLKGLNGKALHRHHVTLGSLYHYLAPKVSDAASLDNRDQNPQMFPDNLAQDSRITLR